MNKTRFQQEVRGILRRSTVGALDPHVLKQAIEAVVLDTIGLERSYGRISMHRDGSNTFQGQVRDIATRILKEHEILDTTEATVRKEIARFLASREGRRVVRAVVERVVEAEVRTRIERIIRDDLLLPFVEEYVPKEEVEEWLRSATEEARRVLNETREIIEETR